jgi:hypothetical protein
MANITIADSDANIHVETESGSLSLTALVFQERGDRFTRLRFSTYMYFNRLDADEPLTKKDLLTHVEFTELIIGVVANESFESDPRFSTAVFKVADDLNGLVFDGHQMLDASGATLMAAG